MSAHRIRSTIEDLREEAQALEDRARDKARFGLYAEAAAYKSEARGIRVVIPVLERLVSVSVSNQIGETSCHED